MCLKRFKSINIRAAFTWTSMIQAKQKAYYDLHYIDMVLLQMTCLVLFPRILKTLKFVLTDLSNVRILWFKQKTLKSILQYKILSFLLVSWWNTFYNFFYCISNKNDKTGQYLECHKFYNLFLYRVGTNHLASGL